MTENPSPSIDHGRLLTLEEVAERTALSIVTLRRLLRQKSPSKRLAHHRIGRAIRISEADLEDFLARCRRGGR